MRALFCSFGEPSFLYPLLGVALRLRRRGHEVCFVTSDTARPVLRAAGIERIPRDTADGRSFVLAWWGNPIATAIDVKHVEYALQRFPANVLVSHQLCQAALIVRSRMHVPTAVMGMFSYLWPVGQSVDPVIFEECEPRRRWRLDDNLRTLNAARALFRLPTVAATDVECPLLGDLLMLRTEPALEAELDGLPGQVHAVGLCLWKPPTTRPSPLLADATGATADWPLLYAYQGRTFHLRGFWPHLAAAVADRPVRVVASVRRMDQPVGVVPPNVVLQEQVPLEFLQKHVSAAVSTGSSSPVLAALASGTPHIVVPSEGETPDNAARLTRAGLAIPLVGETLTADLLWIAIERAFTDDTLRRRCRAMQRTVTRAEPFDQAADLVERLAATGKPVCRHTGHPSPWARPPTQHIPSAGELD